MDSLIFYQTMLFLWDKDINTRRYRVNVFVKIFLSLITEAICFCVLRVFSFFSGFCGVFPSFCPRIRLWSSEIYYYECVLIYTAPGNIFHTNEERSWFNPIQLFLRHTRDTVVLIGLISPPFATVASI